jgi:putative ABC transport system permease protein
VYGVMAFSVLQRTREIGIRLALGAVPGEVLRLVVRQGLLPAVLGIAIGFVGAIFAAQALQGLLIEVSPFDPLTYACVPAFLVAVALFSSWLPARRITSIDPAISLRSE